VHAKTDQGLKEFTLRASEKQWGTADFTYTDKVEYQHKLYNFRIPLEELGIDSSRENEKIKLAFSAYGTATIGEQTFADSFGLNLTADGQCNVDLVADDATSLGIFAQRFPPGLTPPDPRGPFFGGGFDAHSDFDPGTGNVVALISRDSTNADLVIYEPGGMPVGPPVPVPNPDGNDRFFGGDVAAFPDGNAAVVIPEFNFGENPPVEELAVYPFDSMDGFGDRVVLGQITSSSFFDEAVNPDGNLTVVFDLFDSNTSRTDVFQTVFDPDTGTATVPEVVSGSGTFNAGPAVDCAQVGPDDVCLIAWFNGSDVEGRFRRNGVLEGIMPFSDSPQGSVFNVEVTSLGTDNFLITWEANFDTLVGQEVTSVGMPVGINVDLNMCTDHRVAGNGLGGATIACNRFDLNTGFPIVVLFEYGECPFVQQEADLSLTKANAQTTSVPGRQTSYTIVVTNNGPDNVFGATVTDLFPDQVANSNWLCTPSAGSFCTPSGTGDIIDTVDIPAGGMVTYGAIVDIAADAGTRENVDAVSLAPDGRPVISTQGNTTVDGVSAMDDDLLVFNDTSLGSNTAGTFELYFDGSDVGLSSEDIDASWIDPDTNDIYLSTQDNFSLPGVSGDGSDIFLCTPGSLGHTTSCTFAPFWDGSASGFNGGTNAFSIAGASNEIIYLSASAEGVAGGVPFSEEDILSFNRDTSTWAMHFDGSDVGLTEDIDGFELLDDGSMLISFDNPQTITGPGMVDDSDIIRFVPTSLGENTAGSFELFFDGSDVDLQDELVVNTATVEVPSGVIDPNPENNSARDIDVLLAVADLSISKIDDVDPIVAGNTLIYTVTVANAGPSESQNVIVTDTLPAGVIFVQTCSDYRLCK
jgi:uncharacterized repeat protein (TIGR01451 family)